MNEALTRQLLDWLAGSPRPYPEVMEAWRTSCPRLAIWEDALAEGWVEVAKFGPVPIVRITELGQSWLAGSGQ